MLSINAIAKKRKSIAVFNGLGARRYCANSTKISGIIRIDIASIGSMINVNRPITVEGIPIPRKPFIEPDKIKVITINKIMYGSSEGIRAANI